MKIKHPRTPHLPWSRGVTSDDKVLKNVDHFKGKRIVVSEKMDGENTSMYRHSIHARSIDSVHHESRGWVTGLWANFSHNIPWGYRICGENMYAKHSIYYQNLQSYFYVHSVWNDSNECLSYIDTYKFITEISDKLIMVPTIHIGTFNENLLQSLYINETEQEGYVVRLEDSFKYEDFGNSVAKYVRLKHVNTDTHWMHQKVILNKLMGK